MLFPKHKFLLRRSYFLYSLLKWHLHLEAAHPVFSFWKFLLGSKLLAATCHHQKGQWIWSTCQTWHFFFLEKTTPLNTLPQVIQRRNLSVVPEIFVASTHLIMKSSKDASVWRGCFCQVVTLMSSCSTLCPPGSNYFAAIAHPWVVKEFHVQCSLSSLSLESLFYCIQSSHSTSSYICTVFP